MIWNDTLNIGGTTYEVVASAGDYDYSWTESALLRSPEGKLYYAHSSGCSCYSFQDNVDEGDLEPVANWQEAVELAKRDLANEHAVTFAEKLAEIRPAQSIPTLPTAVRASMLGVIL